jgi:hypothetical protein
MKDHSPIDAKLLLKEAEASEHGEAYVTLTRSSNYRIGVGVRISSSDTPSFFIEIIIYLCLGSVRADLSLLQKSLSCLKRLQARKYSISYQNDNCIICEKTLSIQNLYREYETANLLVKRCFE